MYDAMLIPLGCQPRTAKVLSGDELMSNKAPLELRMVRVVARIATGSWPSDGKVFTYAQTRSLANCTL